MHENPAIVIFRKDFRISDNHALSAAISFGAKIIPLYIYDSEVEPSNRCIGSASKWWLHYSLIDLSKSLDSLGARLIIRQGNYTEELLKIIAETNSTKIFWNRCYEPHAIKRDSQIKKQLIENGLEVKTFNSSLLCEPDGIKNNSGAYYKVFTQFWKKFLETKANTIGSLLPAPQKLNAYSDKAMQSFSIEDLNLTPKNPDWSKTISQTWSVSEKHALKMIDDFLVNCVADYPEMRDRPDLQATSRLSPYLHFGNISVRTIWQRAMIFKNAASSNPTLIKGIDKFLSEIGWREFSYNLLFHNQDLPTQNFRKEFDNFAWKEDIINLRKWQKGLTGYPIVDAGMRELWQTGWMHNRVRMIVASFLTKHLLIDWREGEKWFWDTLVDADLANNSASWQWVAGSGADASPYFRIFNPILQGAKFDPEGHYIKKYIPELKSLSKEYIHAPWQAPTMILKASNIELGIDYPKPIVDHDMARKRALQTFELTKNSSS